MRRAAGWALCAVLGAAAAVFAVDRIGRRYVEREAVRRG